MEEQGTFTEYSRPCVYCNQVTRKTVTRHGRKIHVCPHCIGVMKEGKAIRDKIHDVLLSMEAKSDRQKNERIATKVREAVL